MRRLSCCSEGGRPHPDVVRVRGSLRHHPREMWNKRLFVYVCVFWPLHPCIEGNRGGPCVWMHTHTYIPSTMLDLSPWLFADPRVKMQSAAGPVRGSRYWAEDKR